MRTLPALVAAVLLAGSAPPALAQAPAPADLDPSILQGVPTVLTALRGASKREKRERPVLTARAARKAGYKSLSDLTGGTYPAFTPGVGAVYAKRENMPTGPFLALDHKGKLVSTIYKIPKDKVANGEKSEAPGFQMPAFDHMTFYSGSNHPGVDFPHYNLVLWHVPKEDEARVAE